MNSEALHRWQTLLQQAFAAQEATTAAWHEDEAPLKALAAAPAAEDMVALAQQQHAQNFLLWHVEDIARRRDVDNSVIAECKRSIDGYNQKRNDLMERLDECFLHLSAGDLPSAAAGVRMNTESLGACIDRMSILALKVYHMREETLRADASAEHIAKCSTRLARLEEQREDLKRAVMDLLADYAGGAKAPKVYFQFKMYNDATLNPQLYAAKA